MTANKWWRVVNILLEGHGIRKTAKIVHLSHTRVRQISEDAIAAGVLIRVSNGGEISLFSRGPNYPKGVERGVSTTSIPPTDPPDGVGQVEIIGGPIQPGFVPMRIHSLGHRFEVLKGPDKEVPWTRSTECSGVPNRILELPMGPEDERRIKIVYREGKSDRSLDIWTPEVIITNPIALKEFPGWAGGRAQKIANWLVRNYGFQFGLMEAAQDFHMAAALPFETAQFMKELGLKAPDLWVDTSRGRGELETSDQAKALSIMTASARVDAMERELYPAINTLADNQIRLADGQEKMAKALAELSDSLIKLLGIKKETPQQDKSDPGGMFG